MKTTEQLGLQRCPHCNTANPSIGRRHVFAVQPSKAAFQLHNQLLQWHVYSCASCGGLVGAATPIIQAHATFTVDQLAQWIVPAATTISSDIPQAAARYLTQARETLASPAASVLMSAAAVDAMLKERGYRDGSLYSRIQKAETECVLTKDMADWAHDIRLDANDERHADHDASAKTGEDAARCLEFADALADLLFVLPARVRRGRAPPAPPPAAPPVAPAAGRR
ncbi:MAG: DUF4145 domain-containing protein [Alphaproteobacteria bacterium]|nr:DUF4145 domain-containing protein [Alphaproteobacteria bacterium]